METSVIVSTHNQPARLEKVLRGYTREDLIGVELIVADDGSVVEAGGPKAGSCPGVHGENQGEPEVDRGRDGNEGPARAQESVG